MSDIRLTDLIAPVYWPIYTDIRKLAHAEYWFPGGRGSAKSSFASLVIPLGMIEDPEANAIVYRKVAGTLRDSVHQQICWALETLGIMGYFRVGYSPMEIEYRPTGQKILFRGGDDPAKSKSIKLAHGYFKYLWFEEPTEFLDMHEINTISASIIRGTKKAIKLMTFNPPVSAKNWINEEVIKAVPGRTVLHTDYTQIPIEWLGEAFLAGAEAMRQTNENAWRHMYMGEVTGTGGQVFANVQLRVITDDQIAGFDRMYFGLDHGFAVDPAALIGMHYNKQTRTLYLYNEYCKVGASFDTIANEAKRMLALARGGTIIADSAEPRSNNELMQRGLNIVGAKKGSGSVEHGMRWLQDLSAIVIDPARCPNAGKEFCQYEYEPDRSGGFRADYPDKNNHTIDAVRYGLEPVIGQRKVKIQSRRNLGI